MFRLSRLVFLSLALGGAALASQAPEFAQQYRQRLNGALGELVRIVEQFDADAAAEGLDRMSALAAYEAVPSNFLQRRGASVRLDIQRMEDLTLHADALERADPLWRPVIVARQADGGLLAGTWSQYRFAVPLGHEGALYGGLGFLLGSAMSMIAGRLFRPRRAPLHAR